jgi:hypothetical protein
LQANRNEIVGKGPPGRGRNGRGPGARARTPESDPHQRPHSPCPHRTLRAFGICEAALSIVNDGIFQNRRLPPASFPDGALAGPVAPARQDQKSAWRRRNRCSPTCPGQSAGTAPNKKGTPAQCAPQAFCRWGSAGCERVYVLSSIYFAADEQPWKTPVVSPSKRQGRRGCLKLYPRRTRRLGGETDYSQRSV